MKNIKETITGMDKKKLFLLAGAGTLLIAAFILFMATLSRPSMSQLYTGLTPAESAKIVAVIQSAGTPYEVTSDGTSISIPKSDFAEIKMRLAEAGLPSSNTVGYELFDTNNALGMTNFEQRINRIRAIEGELARTIQTLEGVEAARVHISIGEREAFTRAAPDPSASIVIKTRIGFSLDRSKALAIRHLVASSIPGMKPGMVTVMDAGGNLLIAEEDMNAGVNLVGKQGEIESRIQSKVEQLLRARYGVGNVRVQVTAELNPESEFVQIEDYDPQRSVARSTQTVTDNENTREPVPGNVSVQNNVPGAQAGAGQESSSNRERVEETVNFEISTARREISREAGNLARLSVAVLVNGTREEDENGDIVYRERDTSELERISNIVKSAVAFNESRGDIVTVDSMQFVDYSLDASTPVGADIGRILEDNLMTIIQWSFALIALIVVIFAVFRPVLRQVLPQQVATENKDGDQKDGEASAGDLQKDEDDTSTVRIDEVVGEVQAVKINNLKKVVSNNPEEASRIIKSWLLQ